MLLGLAAVELVVGVLAGRPLVLPATTKAAAWRPGGLAAPRGSGGEKSPVSGVTGRGLNTNPTRVSGTGRLDELSTLDLRRLGSFSLCSTDVPDQAGAAHEEHAVTLLECINGPRT